jgi:hypothetical protein
MSKSLGLDQVEVHGNPNFNTSKFPIGVSCAHRRIIVGSGCNNGINPN